MSSIPKADAVAALRACDGDVSQRGLWAAGLAHGNTSILGKALDVLGCTVKGGPGNLRTLIVSVDEAIARIESLDGDDLHEPDSVSDPRMMYTVVHDPHDCYGEGETFDAAFVRDIVREGGIHVDGLELERAGIRYRAYQGQLYRLDRGEMVPCHGT